MDDTVIMELCDFSESQHLIQQLRSRSTTQPFMGQFKTVQNNIAHIALYQNVKHWKRREMLIASTVSFFYPYLTFLERCKSDDGSDEFTTLFVMHNGPFGLLRFIEIEEDKDTDYLIMAASSGLLKIDLEVLFHNYLENSHRNLQVFGNIEVECPKPIWQTDLVGCSIVVDHVRLSVKEMDAVTPLIKVSKRKTNVIEMSSPQQQSVCNFIYIVGDKRINVGNP